MEKPVIPSPILQINIKTIRVTNNYITLLVIMFCILVRYVSLCAVKQLIFAARVLYPDY